MSLWNDISEKIGAGSKVVADKAKELSQLAALKAQVVSCDSVILKNYKDLGKAYYEAHKDDEAFEYAEFMAAIKEQMDKKALLNEQIEEFKATGADVVDASEAEAAVVEEANVIETATEEVVEDSETV